MDASRHVCGRGERPARRQLEPLHLGLGWILLIVGIIVVCRNRRDDRGIVGPNHRHHRRRYQRVIVNIGFLAAFPIWSLILSGLDVIVIYALAVHGGALKQP
jgi:uncharacterized iron-regulated membrane protein